MELVGKISVDAGCVMIGDPCYTQGQDASSASESWDEFLALTYPETFGPGATDATGARMLDVAPARGEDGVGLVVSSGYGDGEYPVYVTRQDGRVASVTVVFIGDDSEGEDGALYDESESEE